VAGGLAALLVVAGMGVGGVRWWGRTPEPPPDPRPAPDTAVAVTGGGAVSTGGSPRYDAQYSPQARLDFYASCAEGHPQPDYCDCVWAALRENVPWAEYDRIDEDIYLHRRKGVDDTPLAGYLRPCEAAYPTPPSTVRPSPGRR
jgi:hypothetical protein